MNDRNEQPKKNKKTCANFCLTRKNIKLEKLQYLFNALKLDRLNSKGLTK